MPLNSDDVRDKVCAIVLRDGPGGPDVLLFRHALAGVQLVKGGPRPEEPFDTAVRRELREESGLTATRAVPLATVQLPALHQRWHLFHCAVPDAPAGPWHHQTADDDGQLFAFFWHTFDGPPHADMAPQYLAALNAARRCLA